MNAIALRIFETTVGTFFGVGLLLLLLMWLMKTGNCPCSKKKATEQQPVSTNYNPGEFMLLS